jgi:hypothetical protein
MNNQYQTTLTKLAYELELLKNKNPEQLSAALKSLVKSLKAFRKELKHELAAADSADQKDHL